VPRKIDPGTDMIRVLINHVINTMNNLISVADGILKISGLVFSRFSAFG
jgi:hypothetical protein